MLAEFFLTPNVFLESIDNLHRLRECLFPIRENPVPVICHFNRDDWESHLGRSIARIPQQGQRMLAMSMFRKVCDDLAVYRTAADPSPTQEIGWINIAINSSNDLPLNDIVTSQSIPNCPGGCTRMLDFTTSPYWDSYGNPRLVGRDTASQEPVLRIVCAHSDWLIIRMPQVRGGFDDEIVTIKQMITLANRLPPEFKKSDIFVEIPITENAEKIHGTEEAARRLMRAVKGELNDLKDVDVELTVSIYPTKSIVNRELVAGEFARDSEGKDYFKARWYLTMNHVAVGGRRVTDPSDGNSWNLYSRSRAAKRLDELANLPTVIPPETV